MDKYEYKVRAEEIKELIAKGDYAQAAEIADSIDWRRVKSVMMLCVISDLYKINRRYEDARDILLLAYDRRPGGRNICYSLCELSIKTGELVQAMEFYREFVQVAPKDPGRYILQYKLYTDQDVTLEERIAVLEELKKRDYREKWAYELAYLYHRVGLATRCVEECDEIILWFGEGEYVTKAMELKMLHQPLTAEQQEKYEHRFDEKPDSETLSDKDGDLTEYESLMGDTQIYKPVRLGSDAAAEENAEDYPEDSEFFEEEPLEEEFAEEEFAEEESADEESAEEVLSTEVGQQTEEMDIQVKTVDVGQYNTINLQAELAQGLRELLSEEENPGEAAEADDGDEEHPEGQGIENPITRSIVASMMDSDTESLDHLELDEISEDDLESEEMESSEVFFGETGEIVLEQMRKEETDESDRSDELEPQKDDILNAAIARTVYPGRNPEENSLGMAEKQMAGVQPPKELAHVLSQESDGQISLVIPDSANVEKQITGQMNIQDVLAEWERMKKENEEKRKEEVRRHVLQQTGNMFTEFEAAVRDGLLEQLEKSADEPEDALTESDVVEELEEITEPEEDVKEFVMIDEHILAGAEKNKLSDENEQAAETEAEEQSMAEDTENPDEEFIAEEPAPEETAGEEAVVEEAASAETADEEAVVEEAASAETAGEEVVSEEAVAETAAPAETIEKEVAAKEDVQATPEEVAERDDAVRETASGERVGVRPMSNEEQELYANYIQSRSAKDQIVKAVDDISLAAYTGNVIITGESGVDTISLAKNMIREVQATDSNFSGKLAKISGKGLNGKNVEETLNQLQNGALIIQNACDMNERTVRDLYKTLQKENLGIVVLLQDETKVMNRFLKGYEMLLDVFTSRVDVEAPSNDVLVAYAKQYAKEQEYSIDELGILALHNRIEERQTIDHAVTTSEVREIVNTAIRHAKRKTLGHFVDVLISKRYDEEDMIIVTEKDFEH